MGLIHNRFSKPNILTTSYDLLFDWARSNSLWWLMMGLACCAIEQMSTGGSHYDLDRFGFYFRPSPRQADLMIVSGTVTTKMAPVLRKLYDQMAEPKWVVAMGSCAITGGPFRDSFSVIKGVDLIMSVDVYVPGCPPRPEALLHGLMTVQQKIKRETVVVRNADR